MPARLTSIVPMYNSAATVEETIESLRRQTFEDWECIVINDGSTDDGPEVIEEIMAREPRVRMVTQANRGLAGARNRGIEECRTEFIHFLDADDWMSPRAFEWLIAAAAETGASYGGYELCDATGRSLGRQSPVSVPVVGLNEQLEWNRAATHAHLFGRAVIGDCRFDERLKMVEDHDMWLRLAAHGKCWKGVERIVCGYRLHPNSMSKKFGAMYSTYESVVRRAFAECEELGWHERGVDLSPRRFRRVVGHMALTYATMDALLDPSPNKGRAARMFDNAARPERISPAWAANTASVALLFGACTAPDIDGWSERRWLAPLRQWWVRCADEGWMDFADIEPAFAEFGRKVVHPDTIVGSMLDAAESGRADSPLVVLGLERNGRRIVRRAAARTTGGAGSRLIVAFDDCSTQHEVDLLSNEERSEWGGGGRVRIVRDAAELASLCAAECAGATWLVGPTEGPASVGAERLLAVVAPKRIERWADHRDRIGAANLLRINEQLNVRRAMAG